MTSPGFTPISDRQTRVLLLHKRKDGMLSATHKIIDVDQAENSSLKFWKGDYMYDALSYYWGDPTPTHTIYLNDVEVGIHISLYNALEAFTKMKSSMTIWTDALCIDQANQEEKLSQIYLMFDIYLHAHHIWVWLGPSKNPDALTRVSASLSLLYNIGLENKRKNLDDVESERLPKPGDPFWEELAFILFNPYFDRLWILQEAAAARRLTFVVGHVQIPFETMNKLFEVFIGIASIKGFINSTITNDALFDFRSLQKNSLKDKVKNALGKSAIIDSPYPRIRDAASHRLAAVVLQSLLQLSKAQQCSDPRDRIFSLLGLVQQKLGIPMKFPWLHNATTESLYIETFYFVAPYSDLTYLFSLASATPSGGINLPSWCPNFAKVANEYGLMWGLTDRYFRAPGGGKWTASLTKPVLERGVDATILKIEGMRIGSTVYTRRCEWSNYQRRGEKASPSELAASAIRWIEDCWQHVLDYIVETETDNSAVEDDLWLHFRTMFYGNQDELKECMGKDQLKPEDYEHVYQLLKGLASMDDPEADKDTQQDYSGFDAEKIMGIVDKVCYQKSFFCTEQCLVGLGPADLCRNDELWVFKGAERPSLVYGPFSRESSTGEAGFWKYRGEAFVPAIMNGEAETEPEKFRAEESTIELI